MAAVIERETVKTAPAFIKSADDGDSGTFSAVVSVFNNIDSYGDRVMYGAFKNSLDQFKSEDRAIPVVWSHRYNDPMAHVGVVTEAKELAPGDPLLPEDLKEFGGLYIEAKFDDHPDDVQAQKVYRMMRSGRIKEFSFSYRIVKYSVVEENDRKIWELDELDLWEVGPCLKGANPATQLIDVKTVDSAAAHAAAENTDKDADAAAAKAVANANQLALMRMKMQLDS